MKEEKFNTIVIKYMSVVTKWSLLFIRIDRGGFLLENIKSYSKFV